MAAKRKKDYSSYIPPFLFCILLIILAVIANRQGEQPVKTVLQEGEPLTISEQAIDNYLYAGGFLREGEAVLGGDGQRVATLALAWSEQDALESMTLSFPLPTYYETGKGDVLAPLKESHDEAARQGEEMFLALFDATAATDGRVDARRDSALEKLRTTMDTGKSSAQSANSWRFSFSLEPGEIESTVTILFEKVK